MAAALRGGNVDDAVAAMREENESLRRMRGELLVQAGYPADYTDIRYRCEACGDTGFIGTKMCACMRRELVLAGYESSGIGRLMQTQSFDTFSLDYYPAQDRGGMETNYRTLREFAAHFDSRRGENYLLIGTTGLGKTHLSTSVARLVIDSGFDVVYDTAQGVFSAFEAAQFGRDEDAGEEKYLRCELLILDDLGTELTNNFTVACLYNIINTRLNNHLSTIINTNLTHSELRTRYADRITSRLFGEFRPLLFTGSDIRREKLKRG
jgi:DNA replication protein DnaC